MSSENSGNGWDSWFAQEPDAAPAPHAAPQPPAEPAAWSAAPPPAAAARAEPDAAPTERIAPVPAEPTQRIPAQPGPASQFPEPGPALPFAAQQNPVQGYQQPYQQQPPPPQAPTQQLGRQPSARPEPAQMWGEARPAFGAAPQTQSGGFGQQQAYGVPQQQSAPDDAWGQAHPQASPDDWGQARPQTSQGGEFGNDFGDGPGGPGQHMRQRAGAASNPPFSAQGGDRPPLHRRKGLMVGGGIGCAVVIGLATMLVLNQGSSAGAATGSHTAAAPKPTPVGFQPTGTSPAGDAEQTAQAFLTAWQSGDVAKASTYTDNPSDAATVLSAYRLGLNLSSLHLTEQSATAAGVVTFSVSAGVASTGAVAADATTVASPSAAASSGAGASTAAQTTASGTWAYTSHLTAYPKNGGWYIKWDPTMVAAGVSDSVHPVALAVKPGAKKVTDASGNDLSASSQSALQTIASLIKKGSDNGQGTAGLEIALEDSSGKLVSGTSDVITAPVATATVQTTIDPHLEALATTAIGQFPRSAMVVLRPSTGAILAVANSAGGSDIALTGTLAPGSSMKVVTTTGLMISGLLPQGIDTQVGCPLVETVQGVKIHNSTSSANSAAGTEDFEPNNTPFSTDFAVSCNNAFTQWWQQMAGGKLAGAASTYYGLNQPWDIGLGSSGQYFTMPSDQSGSELAEELYGQGRIEANPLSMASVAATVDTGTFHQPYLVSGLKDMATGTPLPSSVKSALDTVMREVITSGTAAGVGFGPGVYGKTGTAEADANKDHNPNGWMIVFDPAEDLAIAAVVIDSNFGASTAGPETNYVLQHY